MLSPPSLPAFSQSAAALRGAPVRTVSVAASDTAAASRAKQVSPLPAAPTGTGSGRPAPRGTLLNISV